ncbi:MAG: hypothetical protein HYV60_11390, partial [Planctomycetia bacterium]|nr:hypothetical protein [Planctomycetia bacterium]
MFLVFGSILFCSYLIAKNPARRLVEDLAAQAEEERQDVLILKELQRKRQACYEHAKARAWQVSLEFRSRAQDALRDARAGAALDGFERQVIHLAFAAQLQEIQSVVAYYERASSRIPS